MNDEEGDEVADEPKSVEPIAEPIGADPTTGVEPTMGKGNGTNGWEPGSCFCKKESDWVPGSETDSIVSFNFYFLTWNKLFKFIRVWNVFIESGLRMFFPSSSIVKADSKLGSDT